MVQETKTQFLALKCLWDCPRAQLAQSGKQDPNCDQFIVNDTKIEWLVAIGPLTFQGLVNVQNWCLKNSFTIKTTTAFQQATSTLSWESFKIQGN